MTLDIAIVLALLALAMGLFVSERVSVDVVTLLILAILVASGILTTEEAFSGFSSDIIIILGSIFVLTGAVEETGVLNFLGNRMVRMAGKSVGRLSLLLMSGTGLLSGFINNTTATALLIGPTMSAARSLEVSPSRLLMPLAFASILGGTCTLIGTSTNVAVSGYLDRVGMPPFGLFEFTLIGLTLVAVGITYMQLVGRRFLPVSDPRMRQAEALREYLSELVVLPESSEVGKRLDQSSLAQMGFRILEVIREERTLVPHAYMRIKPDDVLLVHGDKENIKKIIEAVGLEVRADVEVGHRELENEEIRLAEVLLTHHSDLQYLTLRGARFYERFGVTVLALHRWGQALRVKLSEIPLRFGDVMLVRGTEDQIDRLRQDPGFIFIDEVDVQRKLSAKGWWTLGLFLSALLAGAAGVLPLAISFLAAALGVILVKAIKMDKVYGYIDWRLLILIGGMTAFGAAMEKSGAAAFLAQQIVGLAEPVGVIGVLAGFAVLTILLTQPMSNAAAALVVLPVALQAADLLGANPRLFAVGITLSASVSLLTPFEPACLLVYSPGNYRFRDFTRIGGTLTFILLIVLLLLLPLFYPVYQPR